MAHVHVWVELLGVAWMRRGKLTGVRGGAGMLTSRPSGTTTTSGRTCVVTTLWREGGEEKLIKKKNVMYMYDKLVKYMYTSLSPSPLSLFLSVSHLVSLSVSASSVDRRIPQLLVVTSGHRMMTIVVHCSYRRVMGQECLSLLQSCH